MKKIIYRKIAGDCTKFFLLILFTISTIVWVLQAVNYLDFVTEDGHGFLVYFNYTLLSFPKIFSRIFPFAIFLTFAYIILKYENKNELVIFWNFGVKKISFINFFIKLSFLFVLTSIFLNALIAPYSQDKARSFIRSSDLNFFESILKPKKFIDVVENLTIYYDERGKNGELINIFLNDITKESSQITFAKKGNIEIRGNKKILVLYDGVTINEVNKRASEFKFSTTNFNISKFSTNSTVERKIQETTTKNLIQCLIISHQFNNEIIKKLKESIDLTKINLDRNCGAKNLRNILQELYSRLIKPLYITFLITISLLLILRSKSENSFNTSKIIIYSLGFISIIFSESSSKFINTSLIHNLILITLPIFLTLIIYLFFLKYLRKN
tara:strand:- start:4504 stop:5655 length:1152 start_codon:yes stop_codon:yes gene_type:complete